ncbi:uncharacterized protein KQ657_004821 [Scheffersomyces spartinae]|uniref:Calcineurin-like phosphoesterase domain-containing protein n=1 Tax=Scheffersomyces spartinae TaxID=45513 RepID=A0A9P8AI80_9ASCO|nr:uncharacterized protein KQ657_004821 [Scheffersomyces spartinae]KAG7194113.1 hypothetical protein KQ657_004821 [Scheffersomyces spartinae]
MGLIVLAWILMFYYHEVYVPNSTVSQCTWSDTHINDPDLKHSSPGMFTKVMLVADPQLIDGHTYPGRGDFLLKVSQHTVDMYLHRNYKALLNRLKPDFIFFLGDLLDSARSSLDEYFDTQVARFNRIFDIDPRYKYGSNVFLNVAGNHDIGFGHQLIQTARERFGMVFGAPNTYVDINGIDFVTVDGPLLSSPDPIIKNEAMLFLSSYRNNKERPSLRILLTHVPLYRDPVAKPCTNSRENLPFAITKGHQYQLILDEPVTDEILQAIQPIAIFSGDDHDYCKIDHILHNFQTKQLTRVIEYTVKSISMAMGIKFPAVQLLTYGSIPDLGFTYTSNQCYLEKPYYNIFSYVTLAVLSGVILLVINLMKRRTFVGAARSDQESNSVTLKPLHRVGYKLLHFVRDALITGIAVIVVYVAGFCWW